MPIVQWSPHNPRQYATYWEKLSLVEVAVQQSADQQQAYTRVPAVKAQKDVNAVSCMDWYPHASNPLLLACGGLQGSVVLTSFAEEGSIVEDLTAQFHRRPCNAVAWNPHVPNQLAAGFEKLRAESCAMVWDVSYHLAFNQQDREVRSTEHRLALSEAATSLAWFRNDPHMLAVGTGQKWLRVYDIRVNGPHQISALAHTKAVKGVVMDPFNDNVLATFSDAPQDLVRVWDIRKMGKSSQGPVVSINPFVWNASPLTTLSVGQIAWSPQRSGVMAVAISRQNQILVYSLDRHEQADTAVPIDVKTCAGAVQSMSWQQCPPSREPAPDGFEDTFVHRLLVATSRNTIEDFSMHESQPLAVNALSEIVHGAGRKTFTMPSPMQSDDPARPGYYVDVEEQMKRRTAHGYSADAGKNLQVLSDEFDALESAPAQYANAVVSLRRLWTWVERVESIFDGGSHSLLDCGIEHILAEHEDQAVASTHPELGCTIFRSQGRSLARLVCGWVEHPWGVVADDEDESYSARTELYRIVSECEMDMSFERAAALALFHGNLELAVSVLRRSVQPPGVVDDEGNGVADDIPQPQHLPESDVQLMNLVAMCFAGFQNVQAALEGQHGRAVGRLWLDMCDTVIAQLAARPQRATAYLIAACRLLQEIIQSNGGDGSEDVWKYRRVIEEAAIALEDRIAFACTYLTDSQLTAFLNSQCSICKLHGNIEGLMISGLDHQGISLLQQYLDKFNDIQTVALIAGRVEFPPTMVDDRRLCEEWLQNYRQLLNQWQQWQDRALLDVELGEIKRAFKQPRAADAHASQKMPALSLYSTPSHNPLPHLSMQCQYCNTPLPSDVLLKTEAPGGRAAGAQAASWLQRQRPILNCCPSCRKPLPKCYLCLLACGLLNPYMRYIHARKAEELRASATMDGPHARGALEFGKWFTWCQKCKHGGHAVCMSLWFGKHGQCGVNGCDCYCTGLVHDP